MRLTVLGSRGSAPSRDNPGSGYLVEAGGRRLLLDAGPGTFMALAGIVDPATLDAVVLSHAHVDHASDLFALYAYLAYGTSDRKSTVVFAPVGTRERCAAFVGAETGHVFHQVLDFVPVEPGDAHSVGGLDLRFGGAVHPVPALVTRIDVAGRSLVYSGDTGPGGDLPELASLAGMLLCEASLGGVRDDETYAFHLTAFEAGEIAAASGVHSLVLTHLPYDRDPEVAVDEAGAAFVGNILHATPGTIFTIGEGAD
jgi:ribonuclease BN (tRNA processing enzyme)